MNQSPAADANLFFYFFMFRLRERSNDEYRAAFTALREGGAVPAEILAFGVEGVTVDRFFASAEGATRREIRREALQGTGEAPGDREARQQAYGPVIAATIASCRNVRPWPFDISAP